METPLLCSSRMPSSASGKSQARRSVRKLKPNYSHVSHLDSTVEMPRFTTHLIVQCTSLLAESRQYLKQWLSSSKLTSFM